MYGDLCNLCTYIYITHVHISIKYTYGDVHNITKPTANFRFPSRSLWSDESWQLPSFLHSFSHFCLFYILILLFPLFLLSSSAFLPFFFYCCLQFCSYPYLIIRIVHYLCFLLFILRLSLFLFFLSLFFLAIAFFFMSINSTVYFFSVLFYI